MSIQKIRTFLWFDTHAEEAINLYTSIFKNSKILQTSRYGDAGPMPKGTVMTISFELEGIQFLALNGGPHVQFNEAVSLMVDCETQEEIDDYWSKLLAGGGAEIQCGWLKDKFGLRWQIVPRVFGELLASGDAAAKNRMMMAMFQMKKLDIAALQKAHAGA